MLYSSGATATLTHRGLDVSCYLIQSKGFELTPAVHIRDYDDIPGTQSGHLGEKHVGNGTNGTTVGATNGVDTV